MARARHAWGHDVPPAEHPEFVGLIEALRAAQETITGARPPEDVARKARENLEEITRLLSPFTVGESEQLTGQMRGLPGRAQALAPAFHVDVEGNDRVSGRVVFGRFYLGGNGAAHGGSLPLLFDEVLGRLANTGGRSPSRTAYLHVNYRKITPVGPELRVEAHFDREEGRKRYLVGTIRDPEGDVTADAEGLFVALRPGQP
ncbi:PaaI family thioesterase [Frankia sp. AvcI1]|uniref:PaaI family thioesterase n=1 Tax=Frankia sp. AvcI1 TaxID=573496 RepID=UPI002118CBAA|nr:PaaI family thioesterase [Frankia sp. AvcI1]